MKGNRRAGVNGLILCLLRAEEDEFLEKKGGRSGGFGKSNLSLCRQWFAEALFSEAGESEGAAIKRESGENPGQSRCCEPRGDAYAVPIIRVTGNSFYATVLWNFPTS